MKAGLVSLVGKPNVGKSTLLNALVGHKVSIVSNKPQTTRKRVLGIAQTADYQIAFIDTPGIHEPHTKLGRAMVEQARTALADIDLILYVADVSKRPDDVDKQIASLAKDAKAPVLLALNKMDKLKAEFVNEHVEAYMKLFGTESYMLTTATQERNLPRLRTMILDALPEGEPLYPDDEYTDQSTRFLVSELIREKVIVRTRQEVPHATAVQVERWEEREDGTLEIGALVVVEKDSQRAILIGKKGQFVKEIGIAARADIEALLDRHIYLELFVRVREDWRQNPRLLKELEYIE